MFVKEITESMALNPDIWKVEVLACPYDKDCGCKWVKKGKGNTGQYSQEFWYNGQYRREELLRPDIRKVSFKDEIVLIDASPNGFYSGWRIITPKYIKVGLLDSYTIGVAVKNLMLSKMKDSLNSQV